MAEGINRAQPDDPTRCQATASNGQCLNQAMDGYKYCRIHGGVSAQNADKAKQLKNYQIGLYQGRLDQLANNAGIKTLRDEIAVSRMTLEALLNKCHADTDLILYQRQISDLVTNIEKLVTSCHKLEDHMGKYLDKAALLDVASKIVGIIGKHITDYDVVSVISEDIIKLISDDQ